MNLSDDEVLSEDVVLEVPFVGMRREVTEDNIFYVDMLPGEAKTLRFTFSVHDLSFNLNAEENAYFFVHN